MTDVNAGAGDDASRLMAALQLDAGEAHNMGEALDEPKVDEPLDVETDEGKAAEAEAKAKAADEAKAKADTEPQDDYVEIAPEQEGGEPTRLKVADLVESHKAYTAFKGQEAEVLERVEREATERTTQTYAQVEQFAKQTAAHIHAALQMLQPPREPNPQDPKYDADYDGKMWRTDQYNFQQLNRQFQSAHGLARDLMQRAEQAATDATAARETAELNKALRAWPDFGKSETQQKFISDMGKAYGYSPQELDASLTDHRNIQVARDALAYRELMTKGGALKREVAATAPKLVRSQTEPKGGGAQARAANGQFVGQAQDARERLAKTHSDNDAVEVFMQLAKTGRI